MVLFPGLNLQNETCSVAVLSKNMEPHQLCNTVKTPLGKVHSKKENSFLLKSTRQPKNKKPHFAGRLNLAYRVHDQGGTLCILDLYIEVLFLEQLLPADYTMTRLLLLLLLSEVEPSASAEGHTEGNSPRHFYPLNMTCATGYKRRPRPQLDASPFSFPINTAADGTSRAVPRGWLDGEAPDLSVGGRCVALSLFIDGGLAWSDTLHSGLLNLCQPQTRLLLLQSCYVVSVQFTLFGAVAQSFCVSFRLLHNVDLSITLLMNWHIIYNSSFEGRI